MAAIPLKITDNGNGILVQGTDNVFFPDNATLTFPYNSIILIVDESDMVTFRSAANNDVLFSGQIGKIDIGEDTVTKANIIEKFDAVANQATGGGDMSDYYTKEEVDDLIPTDVSDLTNDAGYITQAEVVINESYPSAWLQSQDMEDLIQAINDDSDAVVGKVYMDTISLSDLPASMQQAEVKVEIMSELQGEGKVLLFTVTSSNTSPYHWEYTSAYGNTGTWREWLVASDVANYFDGVEYDSNTKRINFKHNNVVKTYVDATAFIKDGMVDTVVISNGNLVITFNTDAGKQPITIPLTDIFNPSNYYDKTATDTLLAAKANTADLATVATTGDYDDLTNKPTIPVVPTNVSAFTNDAGYLTQHQSLDNYYTKTQVDTALNGKQDTLVFYTEEDNTQEGSKNALIETTIEDSENGITKTAYIQSHTDDATPYAELYAYTEVSNSEEKSADVYVDTEDGVYLNYHTQDNIEQTLYDATLVINGNGVTLSVDNGEDTVSFNVTSEGVDVDGDAVVTESALTDALADKQDTLTAGTGIDITNNVISATGGTQVQSDWNQSDSSAVDYIKNKPTIPDTSDFVTKTEYNPKEVAIANALTQLNENKADKTELPDTSTFATKTELNGKQDTLTAGTGISIQNNVISATGGGGTQVQSDWNQSDSSAVDYIKNKPTIPTVPTTVSSFTNDAHYVPSSDNTIQNIVKKEVSEYDTLVNNSQVDPNTLYIIVPDSI